MVDDVSVLSLEVDESELSLVVEVVSVLSLEADVSVLSLVVVDESELVLVSNLRQLFVETRIN